MKRVILMILAVVLFIGTLILGWNFGAANEATIDIDLLWITIAEVSVWKFALAAFAIGAGGVGVLASFLGMRGALLKHRYRKTIRRLEAELHELRSLPLATKSKGGFEAPAAETPAGAGGTQEGLAAAAVQGS